MQGVPQTPQKALEKAAAGTDKLVLRLCREEGPLAYTKYSNRLEHVKTMARPVVEQMGTIVTVSVDAELRSANR